MAEETNNDRSRFSGTAATTPAGAETSTIRPTDKQSVEKSPAGAATIRPGTHKPFDSVK
jgi:hypothetical protein